jgi:hypothetical protein
MTLSLPIPGKKEKFEFFYIPYKMDAEDYNNFKCEVELRESETIQAFRNEVKRKMELGD